MGMSREQREPEPAVAALDFQWLNSHLRVKNTFLDLSPPLVESPLGFQVLRRKTSAPDLLTLRSHEEDKAMEMFVQAKQLQKLDILMKDASSRDSPTLSTAASSHHEGSDKEDCRHDSKGSKPSVSTQYTATHEDLAPLAGLEDEGFDEDDDDITDVGTMSKHSKKKSMRPCKGKRDRYRRAYERFCAVVMEGARLDELVLPAWLEHNDELRTKFVTRLRRVAEERNAQPAQHQLQLLPQGKPQYRLQHPLRQQRDYPTEVAPHQSPYRRAL